MNVVIVHGCPSDKEKAINKEKRIYDKHWIPWTKRQLERKGIKCETPLMPEPWAPDYLKWKKEFEKIKIDENSVLIGHSCGTAFLVRWLGDTKQKIKKLILVAPWKLVNESLQPNKDILEIRKRFYDYGIDESLNESVGEIIFFTSNDEYEYGKKSLKIYQKILKGKVINLENHGHYIFKSMGTYEFPELLKEILK